MLLSVCMIPTDYRRGPSWSCVPFMRLLGFRLVTIVAVGVRPLHDEELTIHYTIPAQKSLIITYYH